MPSDTRIVISEREIYLVDKVVTQDSEIVEVLATPTSA